MARPLRHRPVRESGVSRTPWCPLQEPSCRALQSWDRSQQFARHLEDTPASLVQLLMGSPWPATSRQVSPARTAGNTRPHSSGDRECDEIVSVEVHDPGKPSPVQSLTNFLGLWLPWTDGVLCKACMKSADRLCLFVAVLAGLLCVCPLFFF